RARTTTGPTQSRVLKLRGLIEGGRTQPIADAADGVKQRPPRAAIDLLPEVAHVGVHEVVEDVRGLVPDPLGQAGPADHLSAGPPQDLPHSVLPPAQRD